MIFPLAIWDMGTFVRSRLLSHGMLPKEKEAQIAETPTFSTLPSPLQMNSEWEEDIKLGPFNFRLQSQKHSSSSVLELSLPYLGPLANLTQSPLFSFIFHHSFFFLFMSASTQPEPQAFLCKGLESQNLGSVLHLPLVLFFLYFFLSFLYPSLFSFLFKNNL